MSGLIAQYSVFIRAPPGRVWKALTDREMIRQYLFGTEAESDWKEGSSIRYRGVWQGRTYEDKGEVLRVVPGRLLQTSSWSGMSGLADVPENSKKVMYELEVEAGGTRLTVTQDGNRTEEDRVHSEQNWKLVLGTLKNIREGGRGIEYACQPDRGLIPWIHLFRAGFTLKLVVHRRLFPKGPSIMAWWDVHNIAGAVFHFLAVIRPDHQLP
jgi:uncharacterized protein YndB with AHSA1/START domain